ncbi:HAD family hydrolase [Actinocatenispora rupis]|uniref:Hydrolase of the HAD superfamily n=1 Tax=Actinocatenispora rupis TaxID=519421 RepID=A0A8J3IVC5_9ACTN|nr:HAD family hydrolase [Actinocatenispora rupis]GID09443.1 hypothetical protein Aru02nite_03320 [Actinocatenispora rupis]
MPLLLADLDNTLLDRDAAFRTGVVRLLADHDLPAADVDWVCALDEHGTAPREAVATAIRDRYGLRLPLDTLVDFLRAGAAENVVLAPETRAALVAARTAGWTPVIVTNGLVAQQERKIAVAGLAEYVAGWVVSGAVGADKPDAAMFHAAARAVDGTLDGAWMLGDNPVADVFGAYRLGLSTAWLHLGRTWVETAYRPTVVADTAAEAIHAVLGTDRRGTDG